MNIVVLDGYTLNPGDLSWEGLHRLGDVKIYDRTPPDQIRERIAEAEIVLTNKTPLRRDLIDSLPKLKYIGVLATGYDVVDVDAAAERGIPVTNVPAYSTQSVAQLTFALLLALCHRVEAHSAAVRAGEWGRCPDFSFWQYPLTELAGKTLGIVGFGRIGRQVAQIAAAFGMKVLYTRRSPKGAEQGAEAGGDAAFTRAELSELLQQSDVVSLHCPLTAETERIINKDTLALMKRSALLINTSRGKLIDEQALVEALTNGRLAGAGLDVLSVEPPVNGNPLLSAPNCVITPHIAWATKEARTRLMEEAVNNIRSFLNGRVVNQVNGNHCSGN